MSPTIISFVAASTLPVLFATTATISVRKYVGRRWAFFLFALVGFAVQQEFFSLLLGYKVFPDDPLASRDATTLLAVWREIGASLMAAISCFLTWRKIRRSLLEDLSANDPSYGSKSEDEER